MCSRIHALRLLLLACLFSLGACATTTDEPTGSEEVTPTTVVAPDQAVQAQGLPTSALEPASMYCGNISCNPTSGGTAYCRQVLQEPTAWCVKFSSTGRCCYP